MDLATALIYTTAMGGAVAAPVFGTVAGILTPLAGAAAMMVVVLVLLATVD